MNREQAKEYILQRSTDYLERDRSGYGYICPVCGSGSGKKGTGITTKDGIHFTCWTGCYTNADIIDIIGMKYGRESYNDKLETAAAEFGITVDRFGYNVADDFTDEGEHTHTITHTQLHNEAEPQEDPETDYTDFFLQASKDLDKTDYYRGIPKAILDRFGVGYAAQWKIPEKEYLKKPTSSNGKPRTHETWEALPTSPRLIIPTSPYSYIARDTRPDLTDSQAAFSKMKIGKVRIFNAKALAEAEKPVFIVEGELDAISITAAGGDAVAMGSTAYKRQLIAEYKAQNATQPLIIALDNDTAGNKAADELEEMLKKAAIPYYRAKLYGDHKDANEALNADSAAFIEAIQTAEADAYRAEDIRAEEEAAETLAEWEQIQSEAAANNIEGLFNYIRTQSEFTPTGFSNLDNLLQGGLYPGVHYIGAVSSLGKTTFLIQIADQIAKQGKRDVLFFSLEMSRYELIAKSVSRLTYKLDMERNGTSAHARTTRGILTGSNYPNYSEETTKIIADAIALYKQDYGARVYISEGIGNIGAAELRERIERHTRLTGKSPIVMIDYLQILAPADVRASDKQNMDKAVVELKRISRDFNIPVLAISSFNRDNYTSPVNLTAFKESGAIEYSSDVLIGLQYEGMDYKKTKNKDGEETWETEKQREARVRKLLDRVDKDGKEGKPIKIQVKVMKQRNAPRDSVQLEFIPMFNYYAEIAQ